MLPIVGMMILGLTACSDNQSQHLDYNRVVDVPIRHWTEADTLYYPIEITWPVQVRTPLIKGLPYNFGYSIRMETDFPLSQVPMQLIVQQTDTTNDGRLRVVRNLLRKDISPTVRDKKGYPLGSSWGSLVDYESQLEDSLTVKFDSIGTYRMMLIPRTSNLKAFSGISAIGLQLYRKF